MPQQKHAHVLGGWKKLPAIEAVVHDRGGSGLVLWHDADTMPHLLAVAAVPRGARAQDRGAAARVDICSNRAEVCLTRRPADFGRVEGVSLAQLSIRPGVLQGPMALQTGVFLVRGAQLGVDGRDGALGNRSAIGRFATAQEQGLLIYHLRRRASARRLAPERAGSDAHRHAAGGRDDRSFLHFSGCSFTPGWSKACADAICGATSTRRRVSSRCCCGANRSASMRAGRRVSARTTASHGASFGNGRVVAESRTIAYDV